MLVLYAHVSAPPPRLTAARPDLPAAVDAVLAKAMDKVAGTPLRQLRRLRRRAARGARLRALRPAAPAAPARPQPGVHRRARPRAGAARPGPSPSPSPHATIARPPAPVPPLAGCAHPGTWTAVVTADRAYYDHVRAADDADAASISFPVYVAERRFRLDGSTVRIGRRSRSLHVQPEIDLAGPPTDPGVSRLHAALTSGPGRHLVRHRTSAPRTESRSTARTCPPAPPSPSAPATRSTWAPGPSSRSSATRRAQPVVELGNWCRKRDSNPHALSSRRF